MKIRTTHAKEKYGRPGLKKKRRKKRSTFNNAFSLYTFPLDRRFSWIGKKNPYHEIVVDQ